MKKKWVVILGSLFFTTSLYFLWWSSPLLAYLDYKFYDRFTQILPSSSAPMSTVVVEIDDKSLRELGQWPWPRMITAKLIDSIASNKPKAIALDMVFSEPDRTSPSTLRGFYDTVLNHKITISGLPQELQDNDSILSDVIHHSPVVLPVFSNKDIRGSACILPNTVTVADELKNASLYALDDMVCSLRIFQDKSQSIGHIHAEADEDGILRRLPMALKHQEIWIPTLGIAAITSSGLGMHSDTTSAFFGGMELGIDKHRFFVDKHAEALLNFYPFEKHERISAVDILNGVVDGGRLRDKYVLIGSTALGLDSTYTLSDGSVRSGVFIHTTLLENILNNDLGVQPLLYRTLNFILSFAVGLFLLLQMIRKRYLSVVIVYIIACSLTLLVTYAAWQYHIYLSIGFFIIPLSTLLFVLALLMFVIDYRNKKVFIDRLQRSDMQKQHLQTALSQSENEIEYQKAMLYQQSKLAAMGEMIDNIAHQWRQPLNLLGMIVQDAEVAFYKKKLDAPYMGKMSSEAMEQILFMSQTIDDFRNFLKPDRKNIPFDLNSSVKESLSLLKAMLGSNGIIVDVIYAKVALTVMGSPSEFKQVVVNLLQNARDALMENNRMNPIIQIRLSMDVNNAVLTMTDNGGGIADDEMGRIFEPHFTTKAEGKGSGVGLYISKAIIQTKMAGKIEVFNAEYGAMFVVSIPLLANNDKTCRRIDEV